jgi:excisionase family DNA binding protein
MAEILTINELAALLKMTRSQVYTLTRSRSRSRMDNPIPILKINGNVRFRKTDIEGWLERVAKEEEL